MSNASPGERLPFALETVHRAGQLLIDYYGRQHEIGHKSTEIDLVTEADVASEELIVGAIRDRFPGDTILSEEGRGDLQEMAAEVRCLWLVDPLDGTVNYAHRYPVWGVSMALADRGEVILGVSHDPLRGETFWAERGQGAWLDGARIHVSSASELQSALVATGFAYRRASLTAEGKGGGEPAGCGNNLPEFGAVMPRVQGVRRAGAAVLDLARLAAGQLDAYWEMHLEPWDWAAGSLLVEEAGGRVTDLRGGPWSLSSRAMAASNGLLHDQLLDVLH
jgi:myo-inositol-1(or 4)-monophosphatase